MSTSAITEIRPEGVNKAQVKKISDINKLDIFDKLKNYWIAVPILTMMAVAILFLSKYNLYANILMFLNLTLVLLYRKPTPIYLSMTLNISFYFYLIYSESSEGLSIQELKWLIIIQLVYGSIMSIALYIAPFRRIIESEVNMEVVSRKRSAITEQIKIADIAFINTIIETIEKDSSSINNTVGNFGSRLRAQVNQSHEITISTSQIKLFFDEINKNVGTIKNMAERAVESASLGQAMLLDMEDEIESLLKTMGKTSELITNLSKSSAKVSDIIEGIENIADQTNLLALNATIEAARAGVQGHSFAVVAEEIGKLADTTQKSTRNVIDMIESISMSTNIAQEVVPKESAQAKKIIESSVQILEDLRMILEAVEFMTDKIHEINIASKKQTTRAGDIEIYIESIAKFIRESTSDVANIYADTDVLDIQVDAMRTIANRLKFGERIEDPTREFIKFGEEFLKEVTQIFENGIEKGHITEKELFSRKYNIISGYTPPKYRSDFDRFTDEYLSGVLEKYLTMDSRIDYFAMTDDNGYCPTHNKKYSTGFSNTAILDPNLNRTKRIFDDPIGRKAATNVREKYLVQMYPRDTGDFMNDLSLPFYFRGRHWGAVRIGYIFSS